MSSDASAGEPAFRLRCPSCFGEAYWCNSLHGGVERPAIHCRDFPHHQQWQPVGSTEPPLDSPWRVAA